MHFPRPNVIASNVRLAAFVLGLAALMTSADALRAAEAAAAPAQAPRPAPPAPQPVAVVAAATPPPADVPPMRIPWRLGGEPSPRTTDPAPGRPAMIIPPPEPPPEPSRSPTIVPGSLTPPPVATGADADVDDDDRLLPLVVARPEDPGTRLAARRPGAGLPEPSLEPAEGDPPVRRPAARPGAEPGTSDRPPTVSPARPQAPGTPAAPRAPAERRPRAEDDDEEVASSRDRVTKPAKGSGQGSLSETEMGLLIPSLSAPAVGAKVVVTDLTPPTADVRRWQFENVEGLIWESEEARQEDDWIVLRGKVDVRAGIERIRADEMRLNVGAKRLIAEGNVVLDRLDSRLTGRRLEYDVSTNTGLMFDAMGFTGDDLTFTADVAEKVAENKYLLRGCTFTSCTQPAPIWQVKASKAIVEIDKFVYMWNPRVFFGKVPVQYMPWVAFPIKQERATGFMIPRISSSSTRGTSVAEEFFWAINRSVDLTVGGTWWDEYGWRADATARWFLPGMTDYGFLSGIYLQANKGQETTGLEEERYLIELEHRQRLGEWDLTLTGEIATDALVDEFEPTRGGTEFTTAAFDRSPILSQKLTAQRRFGKSSLNLYMDNDERGSTATPPTPSPMPPNGTPAALLKGTSNDVNRNLPRAEWRTSGIQLGGRKWATLDLEGSLAALHHGLEREYDYPYLDAAGQTVLLRLKESLTNHDYTRADLYPQFSFPMGWGFLRVIPKLNLRGTWWSRIERDANPATPLILDQETQTIQLPAPAAGNSVDVRYTDGEDIGTFLWAWDTGVRIEGPDFERIFRSGAEPGRKKWQHLVEPSIEWTYAPEMDNVFLIQRDQRRGHYSQRFPTSGLQGRLREGGLNEARLRLVNTLRSKRVVPPGSTQAQARDILIWNLSSTWDLDHEETSDLFARGVHSQPFDCNEDGDTGDAGEGPGEACAGDRTELTRFANIQSDFNLRATDAIHFSLRNTYDVLVDDLTQSSLGGSVGGEWGYVDVSYSSSRERESLKATNTDVSLTGEHWFYRGGRLRLGYDLTKKLDGQAVNDTGTDWLYRRGVLSYYNQCVGLSLSWDDNAYRSIEREKTWTFIVSLKDLGNFIRYRRRSTVAPP